MILKSNSEFNRLSNEKKKQFIAKLIITESGALPVDPSQNPIAIIMAGLPGAGKTEFLDSLAEILPIRSDSQLFVRIDLDQIVTVFPGYTPETYAKFRSSGNVALARAIDAGRIGRYNLMIDGTFAGSSGSSLRNIEKLISSGYIVHLYYMYDKPETAWAFTLDRETETKRGIEKDGFIKACENIPKNVENAYETFRNSNHFKLFVVEQKELRDKDYVVHEEKYDIEKFIKKGYNIDIIKKLL